MYLSFLPDEAIDDFAAGLRLGAELGLRSAEIRLVDGVNVLDLSDAQIERAKELLAEHDMTVSAVATPFFKCPLPGQEQEAAGNLHGAKILSYEDHLALLPRGVEIAQAFGTPYMRIFSFWGEAEADFWPALDEAVAAALEATAGSGITPCLENEGACYIRTSADLAQAAARYSDPRLKFIWDPGNSTLRGRPPQAEDFAVVADRVALAHLKDGVYDPASETGTVRLIGQGQTDYRAELTRLTEAGYDGALTFEPHYCPEGDCVAGLRQSAAAIRRIAAEVNITL